MLKLLLDEHLSPIIAKHLSTRRSQMVISAVLTWQSGKYLSAADYILLEAAYDHKLTLVTYDLSTINRILKDWCEQGIAHGGVIFVDDKTIGSRDISTLVLALEELWDKERHLDWTSRVRFLQSPQRHV